MTLKSEEQNSHSQTKPTRDCCRHKNIHTPRDGKEVENDTEYGQEFSKILARTRLELTKGAKEE
jgi:hypothetical protein